MGEIGVGFFCPTPDVQLDNVLHHAPKLKIPVEKVQFHLKLVETDFLLCTTISIDLTAKLHSFYVESEIWKIKVGVRYFTSDSATLVTRGRSPLGKMS